ncbi:MAG: hypothetical protein LBB48_06345 [Treponema sp.]|jgi:hypothetical protein|nr:hypothetical protein [Treponema sp.]
MKNVVLTVVVLTVCIGCSQPDDTGYSGNTGNTGSTVDSAATPPKTTVKIKNESSRSLYSVKWQNAYFPGSGSYLRPGESYTRKFSTSADLSGYIYFYKILGTGESLSLRTQAFIAAPHGEAFDFTFTDNSIVIDMENLNNIQSLVTIDKVLMPPRVTWTKLSNNTIVMRWDAVKYATDYTVYEKDPVSGSLCVMFRFVKTQCSSMEFRLDGIPSGRNLYFVVRASDDHYRYSEDSNVVSVYFAP